MLFAVIIGVSIAVFYTISSQQVPVGYYRPAKGLVLNGNLKSGSYNSILGSLPVQNPVSFDISFGDPVPWQANQKSEGVEFLVLENEVIRANYDGEIKYIRSDRAWRRTRIDIDNGEVNGHKYMTSFEYVGAIQVKPGEYIKEGQMIGQGFAGRGSLYFEIKEDGNPINPIKPA